MIIDRRLGSGDRVPLPADGRDGHNRGGQQQAADAAEGVLRRPVAGSGRGALQPIKAAGVERDRQPVTSSDGNR